MYIYLESWQCHVDFLIPGIAEPLEQVHERWQVRGFAVANCCSPPGATLTCSSPAHRVTAADSPLPSLLLPHFCLAKMRQRCCCLSGKDWELTTEPGRIRAGGEQCFGRLGAPFILSMGCPQKLSLAMQVLHSHVMLGAAVKSLCVYLIHKICSVAAPQKSL